MDIKHSAVAELAYRLWHERGCPTGSPDVDWHEATRQLHVDDSRAVDGLPGKADDNLDGKVDTSDRDSFPASDPPATHSADRPPSNAAEKFKTAAARRDAGKSAKSSRR